MAKKLRVHNSPFGRDYEKISDVARWMNQGIVFAMSSGDYSFTAVFANAVRREFVLMRSCDPGFDDGVERRWVTRGECRQLRPISEVGTMRGTTRRTDCLVRCQYQRI